MAGALRFEPSRWEPMTLRELTRTYLGLRETEWDYPAMLAAMMAGLMGVKGSIDDYHPMRSHQKQGGMRVTAKNIGDLKMLAGQMGKKK